MYLDDLATTIRTYIPDGRLPDAGADDLLRIYAVLLRAKGEDVTESDVHDAWAAWMAQRDGAHVSLVPYAQLSGEIQVQDRAFANAIKSVAGAVGTGSSYIPRLAETLFPYGPPTEPAATGQAFELYKIMVQSSEALVNRRQAVNTFFLTINGALLTASGIVLQSSGNLRLAALGVFVLAIAGALLCGAWRSLITSFGQLNRGKFQVINTMERYFPAAIYAAEWEALGRGKDPNVYRSFTSREIWVPNALFTLHALSAVAAVSIIAGWVTIKNPGAVKLAAVLLSSQ